MTATIKISLITPCLLDGTEGRTFAFYEYFHLKPLMINANTKLAIRLALAVSGKHKRNSSLHLISDATFNKQLTLYNRHTFQTFCWHLQDNFAILKIFK